MARPGRKEIYKTPEEKRAARQAKDKRWKLKNPAKVKAIQHAMYLQRKARNKAAKEWCAKT